MVPGVSRLGLSGRMPCVLIRPRVVFSPVMPHQEAGWRTEHPVSVPSAQGTRRAATATPEPLLDPPGVRDTSASHGFHGVPRCWFVPQAPQANSTVCVLPSTIIPRLISLRTTVGVVVGRLFNL